MRNVVIHHIPRCGSSMIAQIFARHGWECENNPAAQQTCRDGSVYDTWEWLHLKQWRMKNMRRYPGVWEGEKYFEYKDVSEYHQLLDALPEPWVVKDWGANANNYEGVEAYRFGILRDPESNARSMAAKKGERFEDVLPRILNFQELIKQIGCPIVYTDDVKAGKYDDLAAVIEDAGGTFDADIADRVVSPKLWRY